MKTTSHGTLRLLALAAFLCVSIAITIDMLWIRSFNAGSSQPERISLFLQHFPSFISLPFLTALKACLCLAAIVLSSMSLKMKGTIWKILNIFTLSVSGLSLLLTVFSLM